MNKKMYLISYGEYSDYHVHSLWSSKEDAENKCELLGRGYQVEEWNLDCNRVADYKVFGVEVSYDFSQPGNEVREDSVVVKDALFDTWDENRVKLTKTHAVVYSVDVETALNALNREFS